MFNTCSEIISENETYCDLDNNIYSLLHKLEELIPKDKKFLLEKLEALYNIQEGITEEISYKQGLIDGTKLRYLHKVTK